MQQEFQLQIFDIFAKWGLNKYLFDPSFDFSLSISNIDKNSNIFGLIFLFIIEKLVSTKLRIESESYATRILISNVVDISTKI